MAYQPTHNVAIPNFRSRDSCNPYQKRSQFCPVEEIEYISFQQREINDFVGDASQGKLTLEDTMIGSHFNATPFRKDDSLLPIFFGGLMLGEGCLTQREFEYCFDPIGEEDTLFISGKNCEVFRSKLNKQVDGEGSLIYKKSGIMFLSDMEVARESAYRQLMIKNAPENLEINPVSLMLRFNNEIHKKIYSNEVGLLQCIENDPNIKLKGTNPSYLSRINDIFEELCDQRIQRLKSYDSSYRFLAPFRRVSSCEFMHEHSY